MKNYEESAGPVYSGEYAPANIPFDGTLKVVSWNIKFGIEIETAIAELSTVPALADADILLLQEMHAQGVDALAQALGYNYVYYPASIHPRYGKDFGNAVLSKWPLVDSAKLLLPHVNWKNGQRRIAVQGVTEIDDTLVDAYSVHTETMWMGVGSRRDQVDVVAENVAAETGPAIVGGDFNTLTARSQQNLDQRFVDAGFERASPATAPTFAAGFDFTADHIYARGFTVEDSGVWTETEASDHSPIWAVLRASQ